MDALQRSSQLVSSKQYLPQRAVYVFAKDGLQHSEDTGDPTVKSWVMDGWGSAARDVWRQLIPDIKFQETDGNHFNIMEYPRVSSP